MHVELSCECLKMLKFYTVEFYFNRDLPQTLLAYLRAANDPVPGHGASLPARTFPHF